jgi:hypothetical protein
MFPGEDSGGLLDDIFDISASSSPVDVHSSVLPGTSWDCSFESRFPLPVPTNFRSVDYRVKVGMISIVIFGFITDLFS